MRKAITALMLMVATILLLSSPATVGAYDISGLTKWMEDNPNQRNNVNTGAWSNKPADAPTDKELATMLRMAMAPGTAHGLTPAHFIVIRDFQEQKRLLMAMPGMVSEGTVSVLVLADVTRDQAHHAEPYNKWYQQMYYGIFDAGTSLGYLQLAAISTGYRFHTYAMINLPVDGKIALDNGGKFSLIQGNSWDISRYVTSKDGSRQFRHTVGAYSFPPTAPPDTPGGKPKMGMPPKKDIPAAGNLILLAIIVIGKPAREEVDAMTAATQFNRPDNFNFWDPQDSSTFGNARRVDEKGAAK
jgi:hypothetical protein